MKVPNVLIEVNTDTHRRFVQMAMNFIHSACFLENCSGGHFFAPRLVTDHCRYITIEANEDVNAIPSCPEKLHTFWSSVMDSDPASVFLDSFRGRVVDSPICIISMMKISSKEVWKILPSYEELRRGAIGRGKEIEVMSIRCHVN